MLTPKLDLSAQYLRWGVLVGEIVHNIGSALDNLIWELAQPLPAAPPAAASSKIRARYRQQSLQIGFPYTKQRIDWVGNCVRYLSFIPDPVVRTALEEAQAFFAWEKTGADPDTFPLEVIHDSGIVTSTALSMSRRQVSNFRFRVSAFLACFQA